MSRHGYDEEDDRSTEDEILAYTQRKREMIVNKLTYNGQISGDPEEINLLLKTLDGMDKAALAKKKLQSDAGLADKFGMASAAITEMLTTMRGEVRAVSIDQDRPPVELPDDLEKPFIVPGELDTVNPGLTFVDIVEAHEVLGK